MAKPRTANNLRKPGIFFLISYFTLRFVLLVTCQIFVFIQTISNGTFGERDEACLYRENAPKGALHAYNKWSSSLKHEVEEQENLII